MLAIGWGPGANIFVTILTFLVVAGLTVLLFFSVKKERINYRSEIAELIEGVLKKSEITSSVNNYISHSPNTLVFSLILIEYDKFMELQNAFGADNSKKILEESIKNIRKILPNRVQIGRISEDRFLLLVKEDYDRNETLKLANKIKDYASHGIKLYADTIINATVSVGVAFYPTHGKKLKELMNSLDLAVFSAKNNGGNSVALYSDEFDKEDIDNLQFYYEVKEAIKEHQFVLFYQPIINLENNTIYGLEALLRWNHPTLGILPPSSFINILEQSGDINAVGVWGIEALIKEYIELRKTFIHKDLQLSINLSPKQLLSETLGVTFQRIARKYKIPVDHITIEIVEFAMFEKHDIINKNLNNLKEIGFKIAVDGFGLDQNTLAKLGEAPIDIIKLDRTFLSEEDSYIQSKYIELLIDFAKKTNKLIVCEGIEDLNSVHKVLNYGVHYAQGYFFSKPIPHDEVHDYISNESKIQDLVNPKEELINLDEAKIIVEKEYDVVEVEEKETKKSKSKKAKANKNDEKELEEETKESEEKKEETETEVKETEEVKEPEVKDEVKEPEEVKESKVETEVKEETTEVVEPITLDEKPEEVTLEENKPLEETSNNDDKESREIKETHTIVVDDNELDHVVKPVEIKVDEEPTNLHEVKKVEITLDENSDEVILVQNNAEKTAKKIATAKPKTTTKKSTTTTKKSTTVVKKEPAKTGSTKKTTTKKESSNTESKPKSTTKKTTTTTKKSPKTVVENKDQAPSSENINTENNENKDK